MLPANNIQMEMAAEIRVLQRKVERLESLESGCLVIVEDADFSSQPSTVTFSNIPQTYKHLWLWITVTADEQGGTTLEMTFNNDTDPTYDWERMENSSLFAGASDTKIKLGGTTTDEWVAHEVNIFDYAGNAPSSRRVIWKGARTRGAPPCVECTIIQGGGLYDELGAITSIQVSSAADGFEAGNSRMTLYALC